MKQKGNILLTGASTGIGKATALYLDQLGYTVFAGVRKESDAQALKKEASERLHPVILDVTIPEHIEAAYQLIAEKCGSEGLHSLINNAGLNYNAAFEFTEEEKARQMMEINFFGLYKMCQKFIPLLRKYSQSHSDTSKLINIGSIGSTLGLPWEAFYHASKFAVLGFSESLRLELYNQNIRVSAILPGGIVTEFFPKTEEGLHHAIKNLDEEGKKHYEKSLQKLISMAPTVAKVGSKPEKVAKVIARVIGKRNPGLQYLVGTDARILYFIVRVLPISWRHAILRSQFV